MEERSRTRSRGYACGWVAGLDGDPVRTRTVSGARGRGFEGKEVVAKSSPGERRPGFCAGRGVLRGACFYRRAWLPDWQWMLGANPGNRLIGKLVWFGSSRALRGADFVGTNPQGCASLPWAILISSLGKKAIASPFRAMAGTSLATKIIHAISLEANPSNDKLSGWWLKSHGRRRLHHQDQ